MVSLASRLRLLESRPGTSFSTTTSSPGAMLATEVVNMFGRCWDTRPALRLQTVEEAVALERRRSGLPADVVSTPVEALLEKWD